MIELPFEIREVFPFVFLNEPMESIVAWNFWILIFQLFVGILLVLYLRKIVESFEVKARTQAARSASFYFTKKSKKLKEKPKKQKKNKKIKKVKKEVVPVAKQDKKNRKRTPQKPKTKQKKVRKRSDKPFSNAQEIE